MSSYNALRELPDGWAQCSIGEVTLPTAKINPRVEKDREVRYIDISSIDNIRNVVEDAKRVKLRNAPSRARQVVRSGDTLFATVRPYLRNIALVPSCYDQEIASTGFSVLRPAEGVIPEFLFYKTISNDFVDSVSGMQYGVSYPAVKDEQIRNQSLWLPPTTEQYRIVAKIDELFSELDAGIERLKKARARMTILRHANLKHAFEGKVTAQWRERHGGLPGGGSLLQQILLERRSAWDNARSRIEARANARSTSGNLIYREPIAPCSAAVPAIPRSWCWATVDQLLVDRLSNGRSVKSAQRGFPVLRLTALRNGEIEQDECKIGAWTKDEAQKFLICQGDVLISRGNGSLKLVGVAGLVRSLNSPVAYPDTMFRVRLSRHVHREYFSLVWNSQMVRRQIEARARTTAGIFKVNQQDIKATLIPLPPRQEQIAIAEAIRGRFAALDHAFTLVDYQVPNAIALRQSILNRAFSGRLVQPDPDDEPASVLLARIRSGCQQVGTKRKSSRKGRG